MKKGMNVWDIIAWIVLALILLWLILKTLGIINTPMLLTYAPYYGAVYVAGWAMATLIRATYDINRVDRNLSHLNKNFHELDKQIKMIQLNYAKNYSK